MVLADSHDTPRTSCYSGNDYSTTDCFNYGTITLSGPGSHPIRLHPVATAVHGSTPQPLPTTPTTQPLPGITRDRFSLIRVRSPLLTESQLFSLPAGTEMFHFPASTSTTAMNSLKGDRPSRRPGFPIRTSSDQRLVGNSPRHNAASHVLHRPSMPRHPPCALTQQHTTTNPTTEAGG